MSGELHIRPCLDLCELLVARKASEPIGGFVERMWEHRDEYLEPLAARAINLSAPRPERIYVGSSFCAQNFLKTPVSHFADVAEWCGEQGVQLTLVLPIFTERNLEAGMTRAAELAETLSPTVLDEVVVNDFGAFMHWGQRIAEGAPLRLGLGRLFYKDTRDRRDTELYSLAHEPRLLHGAWNDWTYLQRLQQTWPIGTVTFDQSHVTLDLHGLPDDLEPAVCGPLCFQSTAQICEFASIGLPDEERFRPNNPCALQCLKTGIAYRGCSEVEFFKLGRTVYFDALSACADGASEAGERCEPLVRGVSALHYLFSPLKEVLF